jgi:hypothetical protein
MKRTLLFKNMFISIYDEYEEERLAIQKRGSVSCIEYVRYDTMIGTPSNDEIIETIETLMDDMPYVAIMKTIEDYKKSDMYEKLMEE